MPSFEHSEAYKEDMKARKLPIALNSGLSAIQDLAESNQYFWPKPGEGRSAYGEEGQGQSISMAGVGGITVYGMRIKSMSFHNVWMDCVSERALSPFKNRIQLDGWSDRIADLSKDLTGSGKSLEQVMMEIALNKAVRGIHYVLVDLPVVKPSDRPRSLADDDSLGIVPRWVSIKAEHFDPLSVDGDKLLEAAIYQVRSLREPGRPGRSKEVRVGFWRVFRLMSEGVEYYDVVLKEPEPSAPIDDEHVGQWRPLRPPVGRLEQLPIVPFLHDFWSPPWRGQPVFSDAADVQMAATRKRSNHDSELDRATRMRIFIAGHNEEDGSLSFQLDKGVAHSSSPEAKPFVLETSAAALKHQSEDVENEEDYVRHSCRAASATRSTGLVTATEVGLDNVTAATHQEAVVISDVCSLTRLLEITEIMRGEPPSGGVVQWPHSVWPAASSDSLERVTQLATAKSLSLDPAGVLALEVATGGLPPGTDIEKIAGGPSASSSPTDD